MKKNKKAKAAKTKAGKKTSLLGGATKSLRKLGRGTANGIGGLSTTSKVVGGAALVALGLSYFNKRRNNTAAATAKTSAATAAEQSLSAMDDRDEDQV
ncbi:hypothetical protein I2I05_14780 [Hymenobacter sp. BT683]|uniref:Gram-positive cocci surface proteins LPxTG domain-containing protein n=1 Tax=Hymenobacter jeongseonensis TaxID=2791027 RepID=A0ABS0IJW5_9BACT|nr:hypothetical protein [Hymenobacter jeongseonensis]MBF9238667.1 hypothetical protein [Hymenobacter jeongseonensis]